jgi:5-methylcytosine-specific restriction endonuclease McrA
MTDRNNPDGVPKLWRERIAAHCCAACGETLRGTHKRLCHDGICQVIYASKAWTWSNFRREYLSQPGVRCAYCGAPVSAHNGAVLDHKVPIALGGHPRDLNNLQPLCARCNRRKTNNDLRAIARRKRHDARIVQHPTEQRHINDNNEVLP